MDNSATKLKHALVLKHLGKTGNLSKAMVKAGYKKSYAENGDILKTKTWQELMEKHLSDEKLAKVHEAGLKAQSVIYSTKNGKITDIKKIPDNSARHRFLDLAYKAKAKYEEQHRVTHEFAGLTDGELETRRGNIAKRILEIGLGAGKKKASK